MDPEQVKQLAKVYFGRFPAKPKPPQVTVVEPDQTKTKEITLKLASQPWVFRRIPSSRPQSSRSCGLRGYRHFNE